MANSIFVSYRRSDSQHAAFALVDRLRWALGQDEVFFDRGSIEAGADWSETIRSALSSAKIVLVVIGENWLRVTDEWSRRRLDDPTDWVRREVCEALERHSKGEARVIQVLLDKVDELKAPALDAPLQLLPALQHTRLTNAGWEDELDKFVDFVADKIGRVRMRPGDRHANGSLAKPKPLQKDRRILSDEEVRVELQQLSLWHLTWSPHPWGKDHKAQELCKVYAFDDFRKAIGFMDYAAPTVDGWLPPHHPRWENQWKVEGRITTSLQTPYPPGIPLLIPGERFNRRIVDYLRFTREFNAAFPGFDTDVRGLVEDEDDGGRVARASTASPIDTGGAA